MPEWFKTLCWNMLAGALVGFCCGAGCGEVATTHADLIQQGLTGAAAGAAIFGLIEIVT